MSRQAMIIDMNRCVGCGACTIACQEEWNLPEGITRCWVVPMKPGSSLSELSYTHYVGLCNHCENATCLEACPTGATYRDQKGRVRVNQQTCIGCGYCVEACPYGARMISKREGLVQKCDFCAPRTDAGLQPACVATCPAGARIFGDLDDRQSPVSQYFLSHQVARNETEEVSIGPRVYYAGKSKVLERIFSENPPDPEKTSPPIQGAIMENLLRPGFLVLMGVAFLGQGIAFLRQLANRKEEARPTAPASTEDDAKDPMLRRRTKPAVCLHWFNALVWFFEILTGFGLLSSSRYRVTPGFYNEAIQSIFGSPENMLEFHIAVGIAWLVVLLAYATFGFKRYLRTFLHNLILSRKDIDWLRIRLRQVFFKSSRELPPQGMYNAGQKLFGLVVTSGTLLSIVSGLSMYLLPGSGALVRWAIPIHFLAAAMVIVGLVVHIYMSLLVPSERPALFSMFHGRVPESYAKEHNRLWWEETKQKDHSDNRRLSK